MILNIRHTGIVVDDLDASLDFYINKLGFVVSKQMDERGKFIDRILGFNNTNVHHLKKIKLKNKILISLGGDNLYKKEF